MVVLWLICLVPLTLGEDQCCPSKEVYDGSSNVLYNFKEQRQDIAGPGCKDGCVYTKDGQDYCFGSGGNSTVECKDDVPQLQVKSYYSFFCVLGGCAPPLVCCTPLCLPFCPIATPGITKISKTLKKEAEVTGNDDDSKEDYPNYGKYLTTSVAVVHNEISNLNLNCSLKHLREFQSKYSDCGLLQYGKCLISAYNGYKHCKKGSIKETLICLGQMLLKDKSCKSCATRLVNAACCHFTKSESCCSPSYTSCSCSIGICILGICIGPHASNVTGLDYVTTSESEIATTAGATNNYYAALCFLGGCGPGLKCCVAICLPECPFSSPSTYLYVSGNMEKVPVVEQYGKFSKETYELFDKEVLELDNCTSLDEFKNSSEKCSLSQVTDAFPSLLNELFYCVNETFSLPHKHNHSAAALSADFYRCLGKKIYAFPDHKQCGNKLLKSTCCHLRGGKCCPTKGKNKEDETCCHLVDGFKPILKVESINCDCSYHGFPDGGCAIVSPPSTPAGYTCHCSYDGAWTCSGYPIQCNADVAHKCPAKCSSKECCGIGGGDCGGY